VRVVLDQPAGRIERRGLDERIVGAPMQRDDGRGVSMRRARWCVLVVVALRVRPPENALEVR
jgi:hypothetical protein